MQVDFWGASCVVIETKNLRILCDPWFSPGAFEGAWNRVTPVENPCQSIGFCDFIYISHIHSDHFDESFLSQYLALYPQAQLIVADRPNNFLFSRCKQLEFPVLSISTLQRSDTHISIIPDTSNEACSIDSLLIVACDGRIVVNTNDLDLTDDILSRLICLDIDILLHKYCFPGPYPALFDLTEDCKHEQQLSAIHKAKLSHYKRVELLKPSISVPFAGSCIWMHHSDRLSSFRSIYDPLELKEYLPLSFIPYEDGSSSLKLAPSGDFERINERTSLQNAEPGPVVDYLHDSIFEIKDSHRIKPLLAKFVAKAFANASKYRHSSLFGALIIYASPFSVTIDFSSPNTSADFSANRSYGDCKAICDSHSSSSCIVIVSLNHFFSLLLGISHWDNAIAGGIASHYRHIDHPYNPGLYDFLNFFRV